MDEGCPVGQPSPMKEETGMNSSQIKPWHIILFTIAILFVMWQVFGQVKQRRMTQTQWQGERYTRPELPPGAPPQLQQIRETMEREK